MPDSIDKIIQDIEAERVRRMNLTKEDLEKSYLDLEKSKFVSDKRLRFTADLAGSNEIAYHYELICRDWEKDIKLHLENGFEKHDRNGIEFLFEQLDKIEDEKTKIYTVYLIAEILSKLKHRDFYSLFCNQLTAVLVSLLDTNNNILRRKLIIALGWVGSSKEIDLITHQMIFDQDALCRAWSATSLMQMLFYRVQAEELQEKTKSVFAKCITEEKDLYACGVIIEAAQTIFRKKWISSTAVENKESAKIEKAKKSALRFFGNI